MVSILWRYSAVFDGRRLFAYIQGLHLPQLPLGIKCHFQTKGQLHPDLGVGVTPAGIIMANIT